jgi:hypothetical protein
MLKKIAITCASNTLSENHIQEAFEAERATSPVKDWGVTSEDASHWDSVRAYLRCHRTSTLLVKLAWRFGWVKKTDRKRLKDFLFCDWLFMRADELEMTAFLFCWIRTGDNPSFVMSLREHKFHRVQTGDSIIDTLKFIYSLIFSQDFAPWMCFAFSLLVVAWLSHSAASPNRIPYFKTHRADTDVLLYVYFNTKIYDEDKEKRGAPRSSGQFSTGEFAGLDEDPTAPRQHRPLRPNRVPAEGVSASEHHSFGINPVRTTPQTGPMPLPQEPPAAVSPLATSPPPAGGAATLPTGPTIPVPPQTPSPTPDKDAVPVPLGPTILPPTAPTLGPIAVK